MVRAIASPRLSLQLRRADIVITALATFVIAIAAGSCSSEKQSTTAPLRSIEQCVMEIAPPIPGVTRQVIALRNFSFGPDSVRIAVGTTVTWANCEASNVDPHTSTARAGEWKSGYLAPGAIYSRSFNSVGRFEYYCEPHPFMHGVIIVE